MFERFTDRARRVVVLAQEKPEGSTIIILEQNIFSLV
jgi:hypothetical protein